jgi:hypothetical protein
MLKKSLWLAVGVSLSLIGGAAHALQDDSVLWDPSHRLATFINGPVIAALERDSEDELQRDTPLPPVDAQLAKRGLEYFLKETLDGLAAHPQLDRFCPRRHGAWVSIDPAQPKSVTLADLIVRGDIAVVGTVERAVPGIYLASTEVATHAFLRIDEVLRDATHSLRSGQTVSFLRLGGTLSYKGTVLCTDSKGQHVPATGDRLLLIGVHGYLESDPGALSVMWLFVVENEDVIPDAKAHPYVAESEPKPVSALRAELAAKPVSHE